MQPIYMYMLKPARKVINVYSWQLPWFLFFLRIGMKIVWMENAWPIEAAKVTAPPPNFCILFSPAGAVPSIQIRNRQQPAQLTIPQARRETPNQKYFIMMTRTSSRQKLRIGLRMVLCDMPSHCCTMSSKQRIRSKKRFKNTMKSQNILIYLLLLKWCMIDWSKSAQLPRCFMHSMHEQQLNTPVSVMTSPLPSHPDSTTSNGSTRMTPPIMPFSMPMMTRAELRFCYVIYLQADYCAYYIYQMEEKSREKEKDHDASKLERLLSTHSLDVLVYEKRQRKQATNSFSQIYAEALNKKKPNKPVPKPKDKKESKIIKKYSKINEQSEEQVQKRPANKANVRGKQPKTVVQPPKKRGRPRKQKIGSNPAENGDQEHQQDKNEPVSQKVKQQDEEVEDADQQVLNEVKQQIIHQKDEQQVKEMKQQQNCSEIINQKDEKLNINKQHREEPPKKLKQVRKIGFKKFSRGQNSGEKQQIEITNKNGQNNGQDGQAKEAEPQIHKINRVHSVSELIDQQKQVQKDNKQKENEENVNNIEEEPASDVPKKRTLRIRRQNITHEQPKQPEANDEEQSDSGSRKKRPRLRKRKGDGAKKFTLAEEGSDQYEENQNYETKRRRGTDKQYQINRIFRKTQKTNLPNVKLEVDIMRFSLPNFAEKFKGFDMIHCSLPLDMLIRLPNISSLISKGFMFVWAEKGQIQIGYHWLNRIGFDVIDQIVWTKTNKTLNQICCDKETKDEIFPNCMSTCLVGYKCSSTQRTQYCTKISNNLIFESENYSTLQKPDHIYQIGDLMMPGARKLEIGYKEMGGWFTLKHRQESMIRCHQCFRRGTYKLCLTKEKAVICEYCLDFNKRKAAQEEQEERKAIQTQQKIIERVLHPLQYIHSKFQEADTTSCQMCNREAMQLLQLKSPCSEVIQKKLCKQCFVVPDQRCQILVTIIQQIYFPSKAIQCSKCSKNRLFKYYFECYSCKADHVLCSNCFMSTPIHDQQEIDDEKVERKDGILKNHDWKLKVIHEFPETRALCFTCHEQCSIPYWACEVCQNWYWCGKCDNKAIPKNHAHHCHYFSNHHLYMII